MSVDHPDPPMEPMEGSARWYESGPDPIVNDPDLAVLMVRIGMAGNALSAQCHAGADASAHRQGAAKMRDLLTSLVTTAAYTNEAIDLARSGMRVLRRLARRGGAAEDLLDNVGKLCNGKHPADYILKRVRKNVGFHWDDDVIRRSVVEFAKNQKLVWMEAGIDSENVVHRLATDVLGHALFFEITSQPIAGNRQSGIEAAMEELDGAIRLLVEVFIASLFGYMHECGAVRRELDTPIAPDESNS